VVALYFFAVPHRWRWAWLLAASCYFYMVFIPEYILILLLTIAVDYYAGLRIESSRGGARKAWLWSSIVVTCAILFFFKYLDFATGLKYGFLLPIGLSFHTFQSLSYVIEVYFGRQKAERHFGIYSLYVLFFPQLVAGPIERPQNLLGQLRTPQSFVPERVSSGLRLMLWGMFQKTVVADRLALGVDHVYADLGKAAPEAVFLGSVFFAFQIFADFQGYTNLARGAARVLGIELIKNFDRPYASLSVNEFWRRWHMSLSSWFRDYVYVPLGGNMVGPTRNVFNILLTFTLSGLWHGANWTYVVWGALNGIFVALEKLLGAGGKALKPVRIAYTFAAILVGWVFFRAASVGEAWAAVQRLPVGLWNLAEGMVVGTLRSAEIAGFMGLSVADLWIALAALVAMEVIQKFEARALDMGEWLRRWQPALRFTVYVVVLGVVLYSWIYFPRSTKPFIYFQF